MDFDKISRRSVLSKTAAISGSVVIGTESVKGAEPIVKSCEPTERDSSPRPGPSVLYEEPANAPQFENGLGWSAPPLKVSGAEGYDNGEYIYQDWVYDDRGADTDARGPGDPYYLDESTLAAGDIVYPSDEDRYQNNAADILEFRCKIERNTVVYRITLTTMVDPSAAILAIGINTGGTCVTDWGRNLGELGAPVDHVLFVWGDEATLCGPDGTVQSMSVNERRNQIEVAVDLQTGTETWRHYCVSGIHDGEGNFAPVQQNADENNPGGANNDDPPPVFNIAFRNEPISPWRETQQAQSLAERDISDFGADINFGHLRRNRTDRSQADPTKLTGFVNRLYSSRIAISGQSTYSPGKEGVDNNGRIVLTGRIQPYSVYVPENYEPADPGPLHVLLHSLGLGYNQYAREPEELYVAGSPNMIRQLGEQRDALILMPAGRGSAGWWHDEAEYDLFEAWGDFRAQYAYDDDRVTIGGYSMGGYGTYRIASLYPDLFARGFEIAGPPDENFFGGPTNGAVESEHNATNVVDNLRHIPLLMWHGANDELVPLPGPVNYAEALTERGYRHEIGIFPGYDHSRFAYIDEWERGRRFLEDATVTRQPSHVTYRSVPKMGHTVKDSGFTLKHDSAYWISDIQVAESESNDGGMVDAVSRANKNPEPVAETYEETGMNPTTHAKRGVRWLDSIGLNSVENKIDLELTNISELTVWAEEAGMNSSRDIDLFIVTNTDVEIRLATSDKSVPIIVPAGQREVTVNITDCD
jgi:dienelactone hydrolase